MNKQVLEGYLSARSKYLCVSPDSVLYIELENNL